MSIKKYKTSKKAKNDYDINFRSIPTLGFNSEFLRVNKTVPKKLMPTTKLVGYTKEGVPIYEPVETQNHIAANNISSGTKRLGKMHSLKRRITMG